MRETKKSQAFKFLFPAVFTIVLVTLVPLVTAFGLSFYNATVMGGGGIVSHFAGLKNYRLFLFGRDSSEFWQSVRLTFYFTVVSLTIEIILGTGMALILNQPFRGRNVLRALILIPWAVPTVVNARLWQWIYDGDPYGALNSVLMRLHIIKSAQNWLDLSVPFGNVPLLGKFFSFFNVTKALHMIVIGDTWKVTPLVALLLLAALQTIDHSLYEAAAIDGAGSVKQFWTITLPALKPMLLVILVLRTMELFRVFDILYIMTGMSIKVLAILTYQEGIAFLNLGHGAALSFLVALFILLLSLVYIKILGKEALA